MRQALVIISFALACFALSQAAVFRRGDKISDHFKQLDLPPEEIDPNVAPLDDGPNKVSIIESQIIDDLEDQANAVAEMEEAEAAQAAQAAQAALAAATTIVPALASAQSESATVATTALEATTAPLKGEDEPSGLARYCKCTGNHCDCCRYFSLPFVPVKGPGCARMSYLGNEKMAVSLKYGDLTLITRTVSSKRARPICVGLPGGYSQFCGRVYGLSKASENFKACLGFELRADDEVEAALRVSCFKFGPEGLRVADAEPLPSETVKEDDDDDDIFGFAAGGDEDDEDEYDEDNEDEDDEEEADEEEETEADYADDDEAENEEAPADADYGGFSLAGLLEELDDDDEDDSKPSATPAATAAAAVAPAIASVVAPVTAVTAEATRAADTLQSKDDLGPDVDTVTDSLAETTAASTVNEAAVAVATATATATVAEVPTETKPKGKRSKKSKKNKKKKTDDSDTDFAYDILNGLLDFFN